MNNSVKFLEKGYLIRVKSWENDGDNYRTLTTTVESKEEALLIKHLCEDVFRSETNNGGGIGNLMEDDIEIGEGIILNYLIKFPDILTFNKANINDVKEKVQLKYPEAENDWKYYIVDYYSEVNDSPIIDKWIDIVSNYKHTLMGGSEWYYSRICEKIELFYVKEDIMLDIVE